MISSMIFKSNVDKEIKYDSFNSQDFVTGLMPTVDPFKQAHEKKSA